MMTLRALAGAALAAASLLLSSCMLLPGKFGSELTLRSDGSFAFSYKGDIHLIALSKLAADTARQEQGAGKVPYEPQPCYDEETIEERKCSAKELAFRVPGVSLRSCHSCSSSASCCSNSISVYSWPR